LAFLLFIWLESPKLRVSGIDAYVSAFYFTRFSITLIV
jgi:hypothetical protein